MRQQSLPVAKYKSNKLPSNGLEFLGFVRKEAKDIISTEINVEINGTTEINSNFIQNDMDSAPFPIPLHLLPYSSWHQKLKSQTERQRELLNKKRNPQKHSIKNINSMVESRLNAESLTKLSKKDTFKLIILIKDYLSDLVDGSITISNTSSSYSTLTSTTSTTFLKDLLKWTFYLLVYADTIVVGDEMHELRCLCKLVRELRLKYINGTFDSTMDQLNQFVDSADDIVMGMTMIIHVIAFDFGQKDLKDPDRPVPESQG